MKWALAIVVLAGNFYLSNILKSEAKSSQVVINSIVQRPDGVFFDVTVDGKTHQIVSAPAAQAILERTCPSVRFAPGVMR